ncbi:MAG TPA: hypothetical protein VMM38_01310 [Aridibacter sp.]|nr:hypothetical protein [Aridibacter sp.]
MSMKVLNGLDMSSTKVENLGAPTNENDAARLADVNSAVEGLAWKDSCRVATQGDLNLASPGASIDGIAMSNGDRVLVRAQTAAAENGIYIFNGDATPMTRAADANTADELEQAVATVEEGTSAGTTYRQTQVNFVLDTNDVTWTQFGTSAPSASETTPGLIEIATQTETDTGSDDARAVTPLKLATWIGKLQRHEANVGDGAATQIDVSHNFNSRDVAVEAYRNSSPWDTVICDVSRPDANTVRLNFAVAPTSGQFRVVIKR